MAGMGKGSMTWGGFDKEPAQPHGPKTEGKKPLVISHTKSPQRKISPPRKATSKSSI